MLRHPYPLLAPVTMCLLASQAAACGGSHLDGAPDGPVEDAPSAVDRAPLRWQSESFTPVRVTPLDHRGQPVPCVTGGNTRPCDIEVTAEAQVFYRAHTPVAAGVIGPGLALRRTTGDDPVFALASDGQLVGVGLFQPRDAAQVLFCRLTEEPALRCRHEFRASERDRIWNEDNCAASFVARASGDEISITFDAYPDVPPAVSARIDPPTASDADQALALFVLAMAVVDGDTGLHTPHVEDMPSPPGR